MFMLVEQMPRELKTKEEKKNMISVKVEVKAKTLESHGKLITDKEV